MFGDFEYIIIGAGLYGIVTAERIANSGRKVCIIEKRNHIGGNCHDAVDTETGILFHTYGPHIFHTNNLHIIDYLSTFGRFNRYFHQVLSFYRDKLYQLPFNLETINSFYDVRLRPFEVHDFLMKEIAKECYSQPSNMEEKAISMIGRPLYEAFIRDYTIKQWGKHPRELPASIINRIPVRTDYYECYYSDYFCGMPCDGYTKLFERMLTNPNIEVMLNTDYFSIRECLPASKKIIYTGSIDQYFNYKYGKLEYRTVRFERETPNVSDWQGTSVVNYPEAHYPFTRICEPKHFYRERWLEYPDRRTLIFKEFSEMDHGNNPYYPINNKYNQELALKYKEEAIGHPNLKLGGRLGEYQYFDMDVTVKSALDHAAEILASE